MFSSPLTYDEPLFRPPSEGRSLIFQVSIGCSWNKCSFCEMYTSKKFRIKAEEDINAEIALAAKHFPDTHKVFLADGNAMVLKSEKLLRILQSLNNSFPKITRISAYAIPKDLKNKTVAELEGLHKAGLKLIYVGIESGDDELLAMINKGESAASTIESLAKARQAGIKTSVMIINGLGGKTYSTQHSQNSARVINAIQPEFLSTLVLSFPYGADHYRKRFKGNYETMNILDLLWEQKTFIAQLELSETVFRSDHASNYMALKGILNRDKNHLLNELESAIAAPEHAPLREEWQRGL